MPLSRRAVMVTGGLLGGGVLFGTLGVGALVATYDDLALQRAVLGSSARLLVQWISLSADGRVTLHTPHTEMGQGTHTGLLQIVLDELDADPATTRVLQAPADPAFNVAKVLEGFMLGDEADGFMGALAAGAFGRMAWLGQIQFTGGSSAVRFTGWRGIRRAAASARMMLVDSAAERLGVPADRLTTRDGRVHHADSGRSVGYGELVDAVMGRPLPDTPRFKPAPERRFIGTRHPRIDLPDKVFGQPVYGIDVAVGQMRHAAVAAPPLVGGTITGVRNLAEVEGRRGVERVIPLADCVAVVADNPWRAEQAARALDIACEPPVTGRLHSPELAMQRRAALSGELQEVVSSGESPARLTGDGLVHAEYATPHLAHAPMEPMNCTVWTEGEAVHVAVGVQDPLAARRKAAEVLARPLEQVVLHTRTMGGSFGRRGSVGGSGHNFLRVACDIHNQVGGAVKMVWARETGLRMSTYHPADLKQMWARLGEDGLPVALYGRSYAPVSIAHEARPVYPLPSVLVESAQGEPAVPSGVWRSVDCFHHTFFNECFIDECAEAAGQDPIDYRLALLASDARGARVLRRVAEASGWRGRVVGDKGYGVAFARCFGSVVAEVVEVSLRDGTPVVERVWCALDCGTPVNPGSVEAQAQGGIVWALSAALHGEISFEQGRMVQSNFHDYRVMRLGDGPRISVEVMSSPKETVGGVGEVSVPPLAPALANALAAIQERPRRLPLAPQNPRNQ